MSAVGAAARGFGEHAKPGRALSSGDSTLAGSRTNGQQKKGHPENNHP
jgi:hypothetical protein